MAGDTPDRRGFVSGPERSGGAAHHRLSAGERARSEAEGAERRGGAAGRGGDASRQRTGGRAGAGGAGATARPRMGTSGDGTGEPPLRGTMSEARRDTPRGRSGRDASGEANGRGDPFRPALE